jgi:fumarylacetoacetate (FAA) hydrolase
VLVHDRDGGVPAGAFAPTVQALLDDMTDLAPVLHHRRQALDRTGWGGAHAFDPKQWMAPLPRAYQWVYRNHARLIYQWRKEPIPTRYEGEPLVYQGGLDVMLGPTWRRRSASSPLTCPWAHRTR